MLIKFSVKNFRNFKDWTDFDLTSDKKYTFNEEAVESGVIKHAMVYGENAQGKSNLGIAMIEVTSLISSSTIPDIDNYENADSNSDVSEFIYQFILNQQKVKYHYGKRKQSIVFEHFYIDDELKLSWDKSKNAQATIELEGSHTLNKNLSHNIHSIILYVKNNANLANNKTNTTFLEFLAFINNMWLFRSTSIGGPLKLIDVVLTKIIESNTIVKLESFLNSFGINCQLEIYQGLKGKEVVFSHKNKKLSFAETASSGTKELTLLFGFFENSEISFAYIDEFDAFYHHNLAKAITKLTAKLKVQTILSTHNTSIMSNDILRPDCYFEIKDSEIKPLHELTDRELRKAHSLEKLYRSGAFNES